MVCHQNDSMNRRKKYNKPLKKSYYSKGDTYFNEYDNSEYKSSNSYTRKYNSSSNRGYKRRKDNRKYKDSKKEYESSKNKNTEELKNKRFDILD